MSKQTSSFRPETAITNLTSAPSGILQRKCACGNHTIGRGECAECAKGNNSVQPKASDHSALGASHSLSYGSIIQPKLTIGASNDPLELEADRVADHVMALPTHPAVSGAPPRIQRYAREPARQAEVAPTSVDRVLAGPGRALDTGLRQDMEQRFGHDFSRVRVHSGGAAEQSARDVNANAFTVGHDVVFGAGMFAPGTDSGRRLLAHELTHVMQNRSISVSDPFALRRDSPAKAAPDPTQEPTRSENVPVQWTWKDLALYPLLLDVWKDLVLKELTPGDRKLLALKGTEGAAFYAWAMAVGLAPHAVAGGDKPKDLGDGLKGVAKYADTLTGLTPASDSILDPLSRIVGLRVDDYLSSDLFETRLKAHTANVTALYVLAQATWSVIQGVKKKNDDPNTLEGDAWTQQTGLVKLLVNAIFKKSLKAPTFFDVGPMQLATHPAFSAAPFAGGGAPSGLTFERNQDIDGKVREQKYGLTLNLPQFIKPGGATATDIADPAKYRGWQGSAWFTYEAANPLKVTPDKQLAEKWKGGTIFGYGGHLGELEAGAQYCGQTGKELTSWFMRGGYGYAAGEKAAGVKKIGFTATFMEWKENFILAPRTGSGAAAGGWGLKTSPFVNIQIPVGKKSTIDASAAISFVTGAAGSDKTSAGISDASVGLAYTYMGNTAKGKLPAFKLDLSGSVSRLDWFDKNSPLLMGLQAKGNIGNAFVGVNVMTGASVKSSSGGSGIPEARLDQMGPTVKTMVPTTILFTGGYSF